MKGTIKQLLKELGLLILFSAGLILILTLAAGIRQLLGGSFPGALWRLCAFAGGIIWLLAAVFLLSSRLGRKRMELWAQRFPHISFAWALVIIGGVLIGFACAVNYFQM